ncbi:WxL domain-containing protein [Companilactobacillus mishanensis]|uniref:WxL domain-containing protein n=1 Tax=Companilactobacillus mishanensis TaxID=2486008 RepID=UPI001295FC76|nr:WxL domain-containing protein [Companilactobacillus mishanensis]MQS90239.1 hypothetical protein [Companilactobacillus mishanensis]
MKKLIKVTTLLGAAVLGLSTAGVGVANAAQFTPAEDGGAPTTTGNSNADVNLTQDKDAAVQLASAPDLTFTETALDGAAHNAVAATKVTDPVSVVNPGLVDGWSVTVKAGDFIDSNDPTNILKGAQIHLTAGDVTSDTTDQTGVSALDVNPSDAESPIFTATKGNGIGTWNQQHKLSNATLDIPSGAKAGNYTADLTWTLTDAPTA